MRKKIDYDKYKTKISLPDFLKNQLGFTFARNSTNNYPKMISPCGELLTVIRKNSKGNYVCWDARNSNIIEKGSSIFDIIVWDTLKKNNAKIGFEAIVEILDKYMESGEYIEPNTSTYQISIGSTVAFDYSTRNTKDIYDHKILEQRGIDIEILKDDIWKDVFRNTTFYNSKTRSTFTNLVYRMNSESSIVGLSVHLSNGEKRIEGNKVNAIASTKRRFGEPIGRLHVFESMIDAISYFQLHYFRKNNNSKIQMVSTEGSLTTEQIDLISKIQSKSEGATVELNFDNDIHGITYAIRFFIHQYLKQQETILNNIEFAIKEKYYNRYDVTLKIKTINNIKLEQKKIQEYFANLQNLEVQEENNIYNIYFVISLVQLKQYLSEILLPLLGNQVEIKYSRSKDYSDDLKKQLGNKILYNL